jgi:hypothetical protein
VFIRVAQKIIMTTMNSAKDDNNNGNNEQLNNDKLIKMTNLLKTSLKLVKRI